MPDYGWAYINLDVLKTIDAPPNVTGTIGIIKDQFTLSGSKFLAFATASKKVGIGLNFPTVVPSYQLDVSASVSETTAARFVGDIQVSGNAFISGNLNVNHLIADTVISSSNLIISDTVIGLGFGDPMTNTTGSVGDRGMVFGLEGNLNQAILWDQSSGSFVMGKVASQGPEAKAFDITEPNLGSLRLGQLTGAAGVSGALGQFDSLSVGTTLTTLSAISGGGTLRIHGDITGSDTLYVSAVDDRVGINNSAPLVALDVTGDISGSSTLQIHGDITGSDTLYVSSVNDRVGINKSSPGGDLHVVSDGSDTLFVKGGKVTLGAAQDADGQLDVRGSITGSSTLKIHGSITGSDTLYVEASTDRVGIRRPLPNAVLHLSQSGATDNEGKPMLLIETPGARAGAQQTKPAFIVTSSIPDDYSEGRVGINTDDPSGVLHVKSKLGGEDGKDTLVIHDNKIVVGDTNANAKLAIHNNKDSNHILRIDTTNDDDFRYGLFYVSGTGDPTKAGFFGSDASGSALVVSGSSFLTDVTASLGISGSAGRFHEIDADRINVENITATGGTINNVPIGGSTRAAGAFTTITGSSTLKIHGDITGSDTLYVAALDDRVGINNAAPTVALDVTGDINVSGDLLVARKIIHSGDSDTLIDFTNDDINFQAGGINFLDLTEDTQNEVTINEEGVDIDFRVESNNSSHLLFTEGSSDRLGIGASSPQARLHVSSSAAGDKSLVVSAHEAQSTDIVVVQSKTGASAFKIDQDGNVSGSNTLRIHSHITGSDTLYINAETDRVGIRRKLPNAVLHLSQSGATDNEGKPMLLIETPGARAGAQQPKPVFIVTSSIPDNYSEGRVGINTDDPFGVLHIKSKLDGESGKNTLVVHDNKVVIGDTNANAKFAIHNNKDTKNILRIDTTDDDDFRYGLFYVSGSGDTSRAGVFGSDATGSALAVSGSSHLSSLLVDYTGSVSADYTVKSTDYAIEIDTSGASLKVFLPSAASAGKGRIIAVKDGANNAGNNNIKITGSTASDLIEYGVETLITDNKGSKTVISDGVRKWFVIAKV